MNINSLASEKNLLLAWRRVQTAANGSYKKYFKILYQNYDIGIKSNIKDLRLRILSNSYIPKTPLTVYQPKPSGLQRPIKLLDLEDQIILQAIANLYEKKLESKRIPLQDKYIFSNYANNKGDIFFLKNWKKSYKTYNQTIENKFYAGNKCIAEYDLAAFFDTVSHIELIKVLLPKLNPSPLLDFLKFFLNSISSHEKGIPQGPKASDYLAECFLLSIDLLLSKKKINYIRYVDDYRIFGKSILEVQKHISTLEIASRNKGLIPQSSKTNIKEYSVFEIPDSPSVPDDQVPQYTYSISPEQGHENIIESLDSTNILVTNKTLFKHTLYNTTPSNKIKNLLIKIVSSNQALIDPILFYLSFFPSSKAVHSKLSDLLRDTPYEYAQDEILNFLAGCYQHLHHQRIRSIKDFCISQLKSADTKGSILRRGCYVFLAKIDLNTGSAYYRWCNRESSSFIQSLSAHSLHLPSSISNQDISNYYKRNAYLSPLSISSQILKHGINITSLGVNLNTTHSQVQNYLMGMGVINSNTLVEPINELLVNRFNISPSKKWKKFFGSQNYDHALFLLKTADVAFKSQRELWFINLNSFNHLLCVSFIELLNKKNLPGKRKLIDKNGRHISFGVLTSSNQSFYKQHTSLVLELSNMNRRRNTLPAAHPFDEKTGKHNAPLLNKERDYYKNRLTVAYNYLVRLIELHI